MLMLNTELLRSTWACSMRQKVLPACSCKNSDSVSGWTYRGKATLSSLVYGFSDLSGSIFSSERTFSSGILLLLFVASRNNESASKCLMTAWCTISESNFDNWRRQLSTFDFEIEQVVTWSLLSGRSSQSVVVHEDGK